MSWEARYTDQEQQWRMVAQLAAARGDLALAEQARANADVYARLAIEAALKRA